MAWCCRRMPHERRATRPGGGEPALRAWLEYVAEAAIDWLDALDAARAELEDDELGDDATIGEAMR